MRGVAPERMASIAPNRRRMRSQHPNTDQQMSFRNR